MKRTHLILLVGAGLLVLTISICFQYKRTLVYTNQANELSSIDETAKSIKKTRQYGVFYKTVGDETNGLINSDNLYQLSKQAEEIEDKKNSRNSLVINKITQKRVMEPGADSTKKITPSYSTPPSDIEDTNDQENDLSHDYALDVPINLNLKSVSSSKLTIGWQKTDGADSYNIYYCEDRTTYVLDCKSIDVETNMVTLHGLNPESKYKIDIVAFNMEGDISDSSNLMFAETLIEGSETVEIPNTFNKESLAMESTCYNDCANNYAIKTSQDNYFDFPECVRRCRIYS